MNKADTIRDAIATACQIAHTERWTAHETAERIMDILRDCEVIPRPLPHFHAAALEIVREHSAFLGYPQNAA